MQSVRAADIRFLAAGLLAAIVALVLMDAVTLHFARGAAASFDETVRAGVHSAATPTLTAFFKLATWLGTAMVLIPVCVGASLSLGRVRARILVLAAFAGSAILTETAKAIVQRPRPMPFFSLPPETWSFPSGHSLESAAVYWTIAAVIAANESLPAHRVLAYSLALLPLITGLSRIYLGVHYPTDVLAGWAVGGCWSAGIVSALRSSAYSM